MTYKHPITIDITLKTYLYLFLSAAEQHRSHHCWGGPGNLARRRAVHHQRQPENPDGTSPAGRQQKRRSSQSFSTPA